MKVNLIDGSNIFFICWCVFMNEVQSKEEITPEDEQKFYEIFFMKLKLFLTAKNNIIAFEGKNSRNWRRQFYPEYKANRAKVSDQKFGEYFGKFLNQVIEMLQYLPCKVMKTDNAEGDDIIYTMAKAFSNPRNPADITIISADADLTQICNYFKNVKVFHPSKKTYVKADPDIVLKKTLIGDGSDNIKFKKGIGEAMFHKMMEQKKYWEKYVTSDEDFQKLKNIHTIVDLRCIPTSLFDSIIKDYNSTKWNQTNLNEFKKYIPGNDYLLGFLKRTCNEYLILPGEMAGELPTQNYEEVIPDIFSFVNVLK